LEQAKRLSAIEKSLLGVVSAVTQTPSKNVRKARLASSVATAKLAGVATTAGIWGAVSTLGFAGNGTAILTLHGAASTSATLAWIGGLVGGGMAAGAIILPVTGIAAGAAASMYVRRKLHGRPRKLDELQYFEEEILFGADKLLRPIDTVSQEGAIHPSADELRVYAHDGLLPLIEQVERHLPNDRGDTTDHVQRNDFSETIMPKYQKQLRKHCQILRKHADILARPRKKPLFERVGNTVGRLGWGKRKPSSNSPETSRLASVVLAVTFQRLLDDKIAMLELENDLVLEALKRSTGRLENASVDELSSYVQDLSPEQLKGVVSNTKGIYHELLYIERYNASGAETVAQIMGPVNYPGADVQFFLDDHVVREVQLKAVSSPSLVYEHLERYPDIEILVTEETAAMLEGIESSGLSNAVLSQEVAQRMEALQGEGVLEELTDAVLTSVFVTSGFAIWSVLARREDQKFDFKPYLSNAGIAVGAATAVEAMVVVAGG